MTTKMDTNTATSFRDKWSNNPSAFFQQTLAEGSDLLNWILTRNGFASTAELAAFLRDKPRILDAGCGNGRVTSLLRRWSDPTSTAVVGIDLVAADIARSNLAHEPNVSIFEKNLLDDLSDLGKFDFIYCQEVLHHTSDPKRALLNLANLLAPQGEIAIYVYKRKAPVREFVDDFVRERIAELPYEEAIAVCAQITQLGRVLAEAESTVTVPAVQVLGIEAGEYPIQRFVYHFFMKCFWNPQLSEQENIAINYDWYHPQLATRHTIEEVLDWFRDASLAPVHQHVDHYGITVRGKRS